MCHFTALQWKQYLNICDSLLVSTDESVETAVNLVRKTKIWFYIHYIYSHITNFKECYVQTVEAAARETAATQERCRPLPCTIEH